MLGADPITIKPTIKPRSESVDECDDITTIWTRYNPTNLLGRGAYGKVTKAQCRTTNRFVAIKESKSDKDGVLATTLREVAIMQSLIHGNIASLIDVDRCMKNNLVFIVMEYGNQDLDKFIQLRNGSGIGFELANLFTYHVLSGLEFLHQNGFVHRDIKPANILITHCKSGQDIFIAKICDFGLGRKIASVLDCFTTETQTALYRAPELFAAIPKYDYSVDVWSVGCVYAEMLRGEPLFRGEREIELTLGQPSRAEWAIMEPEKVTCDLDDDEPKPDISDLVPGLTKDGSSLLKEMFDYNPKKRITAFKAMERLKSTLFDIKAVPEAEVKPETVQYAYELLSNVKLKSDDFAPVDVKLRIKRQKLILEN